MDNQIETRDFLATRGNLFGVSDGVLEALARALQLDEAEAHLFDLARAASNSRRPQRTSSRPTGSVSPQLSELGRELQQENDITGRKKVDSEAASGVPRQVDALQNSTGQGPWLDAAYQERVVRVPDLSTEDRWPNFSRGAAELGARSMLSFQLFIEGDRLGALNLYGEGPGAFDNESEQVGMLVAAHADVAFADSLKINQLGEALASRQLIGQAEGIPMERFKITGQQAFLLLSRAASDPTSSCATSPNILPTAGKSSPPRPTQPGAERRTDSEAASPIRPTAAQSQPCGCVASMVSA